MRRLILAGALLGAAFAAAGVLAQSRPAAVAEIAVGATIIDAEGAPLGRVEALVRDSQGRPQQVLIRTGGLAGARAQLKSLPISSLRPRDDGFAAPLRKAEFDLLPPVQGR